MKLSLLHCRAAVASLRQSEPAPHIGSDDMVEIDRTALNNARADWDDDSLWQCLERESLLLDGLPEPDKDWLW